MTHVAENSALLCLEAAHQKTRMIIKENDSRTAVFPYIAQGAARHDRRSFSVIKFVESERFKRENLLIGIHQINPPFSTASLSAASFPAGFFSSKARQVEYFFFELHCGLCITPSQIKMAAN